MARHRWLAVAAAALLVGALGDLQVEDAPPSPPARGAKQRKADTKKADAEHARRRRIGSFRSAAARIRARPVVQGQRQRRREDRTLISTTVISTVKYGMAASWRRAARPSRYASTARRR